MTYLLQETGSLTTDIWQVCRKKVSNGYLAGMPKERSIWINLDGEKQIKMYKESKGKLW